MLRVQIKAESKSFAIKVMVEPCNIHLTEAWLQGCVDKMEAERPIENYRPCLPVFNCANHEVYGRRELEPLIIPPDYLPAVYPTPKGLEQYNRPKCSQPYIHRTI